MKKGKETAVVLVLLFVFLIFVGSLLKRSIVAAEYSCLASIGTALQSLTAEELKGIPSSSSRWMILSKNDKDHILELAAARSSFDCFHRSNRMLLGYRYSPPQIAIRNAGGGVEFALWSKAEDGFFGKSNEVVVFPRDFHVPNEATNEKRDRSRMALP